MPGPITQLLEAQHDPTEVAGKVRRTPRRRLAPSTLLAWRIGLTVGTAWTLAVAVLAYLVRF